MNAARRGRKPKRRPKLQLAQRWSGKPTKTYMCDSQTSFHFLRQPSLPQNPVDKPFGQRTASPDVIGIVNRPCVAAGTVNLLPRSGAPQGTRLTVTGDCAPRPPPRNRPSRFASNKACSSANVGNCSWFLSITLPCVMIDPRCRFRLDPFGHRYALRRHRRGHRLVSSSHSDLHRVADSCERRT